MLPEFRFVSVRNPSHDCIVVRWAMIPNGYDSSKLSFEILRSSSPTGPFDLLAEVEQGAFYYADYDVLDVNTYRNYYYIVRTLDIEGRGYKDSAPQKLSHDPDGVALGMVRKKNVFLRTRSGVASAVLVRKNWGAKCSKCYDELRGLPTDADCPECYGTGYTGGYLKPVFVPALMVEAGKNYAEGMQPGSTIFEVANEPILKPKDVLVDRVLNKRYEVVSVDPRTHRLYTVCQLVTVTRIDDNSVVYTIPIPETLESTRAQSHDMAKD